MASAISMNGLASKLDTKAIIDALMGVESIPKMMMQNKVTDKNAIITQLQSLNTSLKNIGDLAKTNSKVGVLDKASGTSSHNSVTIATTANAIPMTAQIAVDKTAATHTVVSAAMSSFSGGTLTFKNSAGELTEVTPTSDSMQDVAKAINESDAGVKAAVVSAGTPGVYRLQITAKDSGADAAFNVYAGDAASVTGGTAIDLTSEAGAAVVTQGADAEVRLWAGTDAEQVVTSKTNKFEGLFPGVDVTVSAVSAEPVTLSVAADAAAQTKVAEDFTKQLAAMLAGIKNGSKATVADGAGGTSTLGVFTGDSTVRSLNNALKSAIQMPVDGASPSSIGISIDKYGVLKFDKDKFAAAMAADPEAAEKVFNGIATRVATVSKEYSDPYDGLLTGRIKGQEKFVRDLGDQILQMDKRLESRREMLVIKYANLETSMQALNSKLDYMKQQMSAMTKKDD